MANLPVNMLNWYPLVEQPLEQYMMRHVFHHQPPERSVMLEDLQVSVFNTEFGGGLDTVEQLAVSFQTEMFSPTSVLIGQVVVMPGN